MSAYNPYKNYKDYIPQSIIITVYLVDFLLLAVVVVAACTDLKPRVLELEKIASDYEMERDALEEENRQ
ncbi:MAG TPA: hypothetical protein ENI27_05445 [bacterium]|nr:hypothetical protein [bacterium]